MRQKGYSLRTEKTYIHWIKRFILFHGKRHPNSMGGEEVRQFLLGATDKRTPAGCALVGACPIV